MSAPPPARFLSGPGLTTPPGPAPVPPYPPDGLNTPTPQVLCPHSMHGPPMVLIMTIWAYMRPFPSTQLYLIYGLDTPTGLAPTPAPPYLPIPPYLPLPPYLALPPTFHYLLVGRLLQVGVVIVRVGHVGAGLEHLQTGEGACG